MSDADTIRDARDYLAADLETEAQWWEHLGDAHRAYRALATITVALLAENERLREALDAADWLVTLLRKAMNGEPQPGLDDAIARYADARRHALVLAAVPEERE